MATYYWVGGTGIWDAATTTNWSATSGGAGGAGVPTSADTAVFNASSGTGAVALAGGVCLTLTASAITANTTITAGSISVYGNVTIGSAWTWTNGNSGSQIEFLSTSTGRTVSINSAVTFNILSFNGVGGGWSLSVATKADYINLLAGTLNTNGQTVTINYTLSDNNSTSTRALTCGASAINIGTVAGIGAIYPTLNLGATSGLTFTAGTSTITMGFASASSENSYSFITLNGLSFYRMDILGFGSSISGSGTFTNRFRRTGCASVVVTDYNSYAEFDGGTITVSAGTFDLSGNTAAQYRLNVYTNPVGTKTTFVLTGTGTRTLLNVDLADVTVTYSSSVTGTSVGNCLGNSGVTFTTAVTRYAVLGSSTKNYSDTASWSTASGGATGASVPLAQDTVILDAASGSGTLTMNVRALGKDINLTGFTGTLAQSSTNIFLYGQQTGTSSGTAVTLPSLYYASRTNITLGAPLCPGIGIVVACYGAKLTLTANFTTGLYFNVFAGHFDTGSYNITAVYLNCNVIGTGTGLMGSTVAGDITLSLGSSLVRLSGTYSAGRSGTLLYRFLSGSTLTSNTSTIQLDSYSSSSVGGLVHFYGGGQTYYNLVLNFTKHQHLRLANGNTFNDITSTSTSSFVLILVFSTTTTVSSMSINGSAGKGIVIMGGDDMSTSTNNKRTATLAIGSAVTTSFVGFYGVIKSGASALTALGVANLGVNTSITFPTTTTMVTYAGAGASSFTVPSNYGVSNAFFVLGAGGGAGKRSTSGNGAGGGGSGSLSVTYGLTLTPGQTVYYNCPTGGAGATASGAGGSPADAWVNVSSNATPTTLAEGTLADSGGGSAGVSATSGGAAGQVTSPTITFFTSGGAVGGSGSAAGGAGAASANLIYRGGRTGGSGSSTSSNGGTGGAGASASGNTAGTNAGTAGGASGDYSGVVGTGGTGGASPTAGGNGTLAAGGGGGGGTSTASVNGAKGGNGGSALEFAAATAGPGGGGGSGGAASGTNSTGGAGGNGGYGAGGGGGSRGAVATGNGGNGGDAVILFVYDTKNPTTSASFIG